MAINVIAPINSLGYGVVGLNVVMSLEAAGYKPALWPIRDQVEAPPEYHDVLKQAMDRRHLFESRAPSLRIWHQYDLAMHIGSGLRCAYPIFELDKFNEVEKHHLMAQDIVFASSRWAADVLANNGVPSDRIKLARFGVDHNIFRPAAENPAGTTVFLNCGKWEIRKGHDVLVNAFNAAFTPDDDVRLLLLTHNPFLKENETAQWTDYYMKSRLGKAGKIMVFPERLPTQRDVAKVMESADCGIFPSRAEGWGLESAEMLAMGKHVILTRYSAHTEYATEDAAMFVDVDALENAYDGKWFFGQGRWAELGDEQIEQMVQYMRSIHSRKQEGTLGVNQAGVERMRDFTWERTAKEIMEGVR